MMPYPEAKTTCARTCDGKVRAGGGAKKEAESKMAISLPVLPQRAADRYSSSWDPGRFVAPVFCSSVGCGCCGEKAG